YDAATEEYTFRGPRVVVTRGEQRLVAPVIFYRASTRRAELPERGTVSTPTEELTADHIVAELGARHLLAEGQAAGRFLDQGVWASMTADRVEVWDQADRSDVVANGHVVAIRGDQELRGDRVTYNRGAQHATVDGDAVVTRGGDRLQADQVVADLGTRDAVATGHVTLDRTSDAMHGTADRATYTGGTDTTVLTGHAMLTRNRDVVTADTITVNMAQHHATADGQSTVVAYPQQGADQGTSP
ncbi:MAG TPA: LptA/OstA family protein, partial [bacterium]|nr:LptA/OstA family protein [bacterium]